MKKIIIAALLATASFSVMADSYRIAGEGVAAGSSHKANNAEMQLKYFNPKTMCMYKTKFYSEGAVIKTPDGILKRCEHHYSMVTGKTETNLTWRAEQP
ncbi:DUF1496 domain-containing protein [Hydrogenovibrio marinus]|uniref:Uncharacterized protein n=1 Tax=Hydrogenovibrio marinus TaxID=28885 RepID=A0A066ZMH8_HYDMR|nr:DUF1496 domain-containing protein [Hydrogenovibrio marinus]KDN94672.1 hypothetical protein EI16_12295 [Hydrogenovibrio marinus]